MDLSIHLSIDLWSIDLSIGLSIDLRSIDLSVYLSPTNTLSNWKLATSKLLSWYLAKHPQFGWSWPPSFGNGTRFGSWLRIPQNLGTLCFQRGFHHGKRTDEWWVTGLMVGCFPVENEGVCREVDIIRCHNILSCTVRFYSLVQDTLL